MIISLQIYNNKYKRQNVWLTNQTVIIPVRTEYDENGKPVHSLEGVSFEEAFDKFKQFIEQNGHLPFATSGEYECSLRRWHQEYLSPPKCVWKDKKANESKCTKYQCFKR